MNVSYSLEFPESYSRGIGILYIFVLELGELLPPNLQILANYL